MGVFSVTLRILLHNSNRGSYGLCAGFMVPGLVKVFRRCILPHGEIADGFDALESWIPETRDSMTDRMCLLQL